MTLYGLLLTTTLTVAYGFGAEIAPNTPVIREFDIKTIEMLGKQIFEQDIYAARATDILLDRVGGPDQLTKQKIAGWIVLKQQKTVVVRFAKKDGNDLRPVYDITFDSAKHGVLTSANDNIFPENQAAQFKARQLAIRSIPQAYSRTYNTVVLPDPTGKGFLVYTLAATTDENKILVGGHYRFSVSETGETIERIDRLFKSFLVIPKCSPDKDYSEVAAYTVTNVISECPLETHVYLSLLYRKPFVVTTPNGTIWTIVEGHIDKLDKNLNSDNRKGRAR